MSNLIVFFQSFPCIFAGVNVMDSMCEIGEEL